MLAKQNNACSQRLATSCRPAAWRPGCGVVVCLHRVENTRMLSLRAEAGQLPCHSRCFQPGSLRGAQSRICRRPFAHPCCLAPGQPSVCRSELNAALQDRRLQSMLSFKIQYLPCHRSALRLNAHDASCAQVPARTTQYATIFLEDSLLPRLCCLNAPSI